MTRVLVLLFAAAACGPRVPAQVIDQHPRLMLEADRPEIVASSGPAPRWVHATERGDADTMVFVGQASASSLENAETAAAADLADSVARFIAVSVAAESEATDTHESSNGQVSESSEAHAETRAHVEASIGRVAPDAKYWEKVSGRTGPATYRYFLRASVKRSEVDRARLAIACDRARRSGKKIIAVVHTDPLLAELAARISAEPKWLVVGPENQTDADLLLDARASERGDQLAVGYVLKKAGGGSMLSSFERRGSSSALFELEEELWASLAAALRSY